MCGQKEHWGTEDCVIVGRSVHNTPAERKVRLRVFRFRFILVYVAHTYTADARHQ
jgi:hypothetical protein